MLVGWYNVCFNRFSISFCFQFQASRLPPLPFGILEFQFKFIYYSLSSKIFQIIFFILDFYTYLLIYNTVLVLSLLSLFTWFLLFILALNGFKLNSKDSLCITWNYSHLCLYSVVDFQPPLDNSSRVEFSHFMLLWVLMFFFYLDQCRLFEEWKFYSLLSSSKDSCVVIFNAYFIPVSSDWFITIVIIIRVIILIFIALLKLFQSCYNFLYFLLLRSPLINSIASPPCAKFLACVPLTIPWNSIRLCQFDICILRRSFSRKRGNPAGLQKRSQTERWNISERQRFLCPPYRAL